MALTIGMAHQIVFRHKSPLTESARLQMQEKLMFYQGQREKLTNQLDDVCSVEDKIKRILECDDRLKSN